MQLQRGVKRNGPDCVPCISAAASNLKLRRRAGNPKQQTHACISAEHMAQGKGPTFAMCHLSYCRAAPSLDAAKLFRP